MLLQTDSPLAAALALARRAQDLSPPNPRVGCVITDAAGRVLGEGHTQAVGGPHAEVMALRDAQSRGHRVAGATAWVTLEPCSHQGRTPPCCDALVSAGVARVVAALEDPNPQVQGRGFARLRTAGIAVDVLPTDDPIAQQARWLNIGFFSRMLRGRPWVRLKLAATLDGRTALPDGRSHWITGDAARDDNQHWRARACAILTGSGTVLADDPLLNVRLPDARRQPALAVLDSRLSLPTSARIFSGNRPVWLFAARPPDGDHGRADESDPGTATRSPAADAARRQRADALRDRRAEVVTLPAPAGRIDLAALMCALADREVNELHVEAGPTLAGALIAAGLADELLLYLAPALMGEGLPLARFGPVESLAAMPRLDRLAVEAIGGDWRITGVFEGHDRF